MSFDRGENLEGSNFLLVSWKQTGCGGEIPITRPWSGEGLVWPLFKRMQEFNLTSQTHWKVFCISSTGPRNNQSPGLQVTSHLACHMWSFFCSTADRGLHKKQGLVAKRLPEDLQVNRDSTEPSSSKASPWSEWGLEATWISPFYVSVLSTECRSLHFSCWGYNAQTWQSTALLSLGRGKGKEKFNFRVAVLILPFKPEMFSRAKSQRQMSTGPFVK